MYKNLILKLEIKISINLELFKIYETRFQRSM